MNFDSQMPNDNFDGSMGFEAACFCGYRCLLGCAFSCTGPCSGSCSLLCGGCGNACKSYGMCNNFSG